MGHNLAVSTTVVHWRLGFMLPLRSSLIVLGLAAPMASNAASLALHRKSGFMLAGRLPEAGFKFGRWLDLEFWHRRLAGPAAPVDG